MSQFFIDKKLNVGETVKIENSDAHHIIDVLRLKVGEKIVLSDGSGNSFNARIESIEKKTVMANILNMRKTINTSCLPTLAIGITKHDKMEFIIQKAVELGCAKIIPFTGKRTIPKYTQSVTQRKIVRWNKIAVEAAKQSGLPLKPVVEDLISFEELCKMISKFQPTIIFWEGEEKRSIKDILQIEKIAKPLIIIGPEGGFPIEEVESAKGQGAKTASLGLQILRVETAAISAITLVQYHLGNMDPCH